MAGKNMKTTIKIDNNYQIVEKKIDSKKELPNKLLDIIIPIIKSSNEQNRKTA